VRTRDNNRITTGMHRGYLTSKFMRTATQAASRKQQEAGYPGRRVYIGVEEGGRGAALLY